MARCTAGSMPRALLAEPARQLLLRHHRLGAHVRRAQPAAPRREACSTAASSRYMASAFDCCAHLVRWLYGRSASSAAPQPRTWHTRRADRALRRRGLRAAPFFAGPCGAPRAPAPTGCATCAPGVRHARTAPPATAARTNSDSFHSQSSRDQSSAVGAVMAQRRAATRCDRCATACAPPLLHRGQEREGKSHATWHSRLPAAPLRHQGGTTRAEGTRGARGSNTGASEPIAAHD